MKSNYLLIYFLLLSVFGFSQNYDVGGTVKESDTGMPIPGVNITVTGSAISATTDFDGKFALKNVPSGSVVQFSYLGYKPTAHTVKSANPNLTIRMQGDTKSLEEVVVIGYGTKKKKDVTGAVGYVGAQMIEQLKPVKLEQALQGTLAGVTATASSGSPGAPIGIKIRGVQTNGDTNPLYVINGNIVDYRDLPAYSASDFESITVLKDAQAAIYGTQGANGVVLITTKNGKKNQPVRFTYNNYTGFQETTKKLNLLNATEYALLLNESYANGGQPLPYPDVSNLNRGTDWQDEVFGKAVPIVSHDFSMSGGTEKITYAASGSHLYQQGIVGESKADFRRNTARLTLGGELTDKLDFQANVQYGFIKKRGFSENALGAVIFNTINAHPTMSVYDETGDFSLIPSETGYGNETINPLEQIANTFNDENEKTLLGNVGLDYEIMKGLVATGRIGFKSKNFEGRYFSKQVDYGQGKVFNINRSSVTQTAQNYNSYTLDLFVKYEKLWAEAHKFQFTLGTSNYKEWGNTLNATGYDVPNNSWEFADISLATGPSTTRDVSSSTSDERLNSFFARLEYDYKGKYLLSGMIRRDSSTKFGPENSVAYFPSMTLGWLATNESFLSGSNTLNFMKLRGSYGVLGSDKIRSNAYAGLLNGEATYVFDNSLINGRALGLLANPDLKWEEAKKFDVGLDLTLFNSHIDITADFFIEKRDNLLIEGLPVSGITGVGAPGASAPVQNAGGVRNDGFEFSIGYKDKIGEDFSFNINYNFTTIKNEVTQVNSPRGIIEGGVFSVGQQPISRMQTGYSIGYFYGWQTDGIFQTQAEVDAHPSQEALGAVASPGDIRYKDLNGDGVINLDDRTKVGSPLPDCTMGLNLNLNYKNIDFVMYSYAYLGNDMVRNYERVVPNVNKMAYNLDRWTGPGTSNEVPRVTTAATTNNIFSDYFVEDASFWRIQNVQLGYTLNQTFTSKAKIDKVRIYAGVNNLYTFTKYKGYDPAATDSNPDSNAGGIAGPIGYGIDRGYYPIPRIYMLGLNLNF